MWVHHGDLPQPRAYDAGENGVWQEGETGNLRGHAVLMDLQTREIYSHPDIRATGTRHGSGIGDEYGEGSGDGYGYGYGSGILGLGDGTGSGYGWVEVREAYVVS